MKTTDITTQLGAQLDFRQSTDDVKWYNAWVNKPTEVVTSEGIKITVPVICIGLHQDSLDYIKANPNTDLLGLTTPIHKVGDKIGNYALQQIAAYVNTKPVDFTIALQ